MKSLAHKSIKLPRYHIFIVSLVLLSRQHHVGRLKAQLAKLRSQLIDANKGPTVKGQGFDVQKCADRCPSA